MVEKFRVRGFKLSLFFLGTLLFVFGCKDDPSFVGGTIMPKGDAISAFTYETVGVSAANIKRDSILTDFPYISTQKTVMFSSLLGSYNDLVFGKTDAAFVTEINSGDTISSSMINAKSNYTLDKLELWLYHSNNNWVGNKNAEFNIKVYQLTQSLSKNKSYYSNKDMEALNFYNPASPIGDTIFSANQGKTEAQWSSTKIEIFKIKLSKNDLPKTLFNLGRDTINNKAKFKEFFKGIYVKAKQVNSSLEGSLTKFDLWQGYSGLVLTYHLPNSAGKFDTLTYKFPISTEGLGFNLFKHELPSPITFNDYSNSSNLYVQGMAGSCVNITLPSLTNWSDTIAENSKNGLAVGFSSVELELVVDTALSKVSANIPPASLSLQIKDSEGIINPPYYLNSDGTKNYNCFSVNGALDKSSYSYKFVLQNEYFLSLIKDNKNGFSSLIIEPTNPSTTFNRVILKGAKDGGVVFRVRGIKYMTH